MNNVAGISVHGHMPVKCNVCMLGFHIKLLIAVSSYKDTDLVVSYAHEETGICGIYMAYEEHVCCWHI